jgi:hypothetical protein
VAAAKKPLTLPVRRKSIELGEETPSKSLSSVNNNSSHHPPLSNGGLTPPPISSAPILNGSTNHVFVTQNNNVSCNFTNSNSASSTLSPPMSIGSTPSLVAASPPVTLIPNQCSCMLAPKNFK